MIRIAICDDGKELIQQVTTYILKAADTFNEKCLYNAHYFVNQYYCNCSYQF